MLRRKIIIIRQNNVITNEFVFTNSMLAESLDKIKIRYEYLHHLKGSRNSAFMRVPRVFVFPENV